MRADLHVAGERCGVRLARRGSNAAVLAEQIRQNTIRRRIRFITYLWCHLRAAPQRRRGAVCDCVERFLLFFSGEWHMLSTVQGLHSCEGGVVFHRRLYV